MFFLLCDNTDQSIVKMDFFLEVHLHQGSSVNVWM
jgi:hypothetical protein